MIISRYVRGMGEVNANAVLPQVSMDKIGATEQQQYIDKITDSANAGANEVFDQSTAGVLEDTGLDQGTGDAAGDIPDDEPAEVDVATASNMNGEDEIDIGPGDEATVEEAITPTLPSTPASSTWWNRNWKYAAAAAAVVALAGTVVVLIAARRKAPKGRR